MPEASLKKWLTEASRIQAPVYLRGLKNDSLKETLAALQSLEGDTQGVLIDPRIFQQWDITQVPAVVAQTEHEHRIFLGDVGLIYALEAIHQHWDGHNLSLQTLISTLRSDDATH